MENYLAYYMQTILIFNIFLICVFYKTFQTANFTVSLCSISVSVLLILRDEPY